jgi:ATP adenylyltransferase
MKQLWAPWRMAYILGETKGNEQECVFCLPRSPNDDRDRLVMVRGEHAFVVMNKFPYSNGHLMVSPYRHTADPGELTDEEALEMHRLLILCREVLQECMAPHGFNIGMNLGRVAGAGIAEHLHMHIVPRWSGDTNFMPIFAEVRVIPQHLEETQRLLTEAFAARSAGR